MSAIQGVIRKVRETISRYRMIDPGDLMIVAVSGGPDSVALLDILHRLKDELEIRLVVAQYNHGLRPEEDESETQFVRGLASSLHLPFETEENASLTDNKRASIEEKARIARYGFLENLKRKLGAQKIAVGHHLNDQAETVIMRILRGSGPTGLAGIPPRRSDGIIRPLIEVKREEIEAYLRERKLSYVIDRSNFETRYLRNKIRLELMPTLLEYQPRLIERLGQTALILSSENQYLERQAEKWVASHGAFESPGEFAVPISPLLNLASPVRNRVVRQLIIKVKKNLRRIELKHLQSVDTLARSKKAQAMVNLPDGLSVRKTYDRLAFGTGARQEPGHFYHLLQEPGTLYIEEIDRSIALVEMDNRGDLEMDDHGGAAYVDAETIRYPLAARNFRQGDRFIPLGMAGHKKVKDFFIDLKIPSELRVRIPILISQNDIVLIVGHRMDERFKVTSGTRKVLKVTM